MAEQLKCPYKDYVTTNITMLLMHERVDHIGPKEVTNKEIAKNMVKDKVKQDTKKSKRFES